MKKYTSSSYLIALVFSVLLTIAWVIPTLPLFIKWFVPFPKLEDAVVYEGKFYVEGKAYMTKFGEVPPDYYIVGNDGRHRIFWGYLGEEQESYSNIINGAIGKVWFHKIFGVIQSRFTTNSTYFGKNTFGDDYAGSKLAFEKYFNFDKYKIRLFSIFVGVLLTTYYFYKYSSSKKQRGSNNG